MFLKKRKIVKGFVVQDLNSDGTIQNPFPMENIVEHYDKEEGIIKINTSVFDIALHPERNIVAGGTIDGHVFFFSYDDLATDFECLNVKKQHKDSCRSVDFSKDGKILFTSSRDRSLAALDVETGKPILSLPKAHSTSINKIKTLTENLIVSGDDDGVVKVWDIQKQQCIREYQLNIDYISDFEFVSEKNTLLATSGDGCLSVFDISTRKPIELSENQDDELLSVCVLKNNNKVVVGTQEGVLEIFTWGQWLDCTDRLPGHKGSIDSMLKLDENSIVTASDDGKLRLLSILPNKFIRRIDHFSQHIGCIRLDSKNDMIVSSTDDQTIRFSYLYPQDDCKRGSSVNERQDKFSENDVLSENDDDELSDREDDDDEEEEVEDGKDSKKSGKNKKSRSKAKKGIDRPSKKRNFFAGFADF